MVGSIEKKTIEKKTIKINKAENSTSINLDLIEGLKLKVRKDGQINGLTAPEALDFLVKNFSLNSPDELYSKYNLQELQFIDKVYYIDNIDNRIADLRNIEEWREYFGGLDTEKQKEILNEHIFVAINGGSYIYMYNHDYCMELQYLHEGKSLKECELEYFESTERGKIPDLYKKSTLSHEIAHSIRDKYIYINKDILLERQNIIEEYKSLTKYAEMYNQENFTNEKDYLSYLNENFAEAVRMYTVNPTYVEKTFSKAYVFIKTNFPFIQPISSFSQKEL